jgi:hypothetical protein
MYFTKVALYRIFLCLLVAAFPPTVMLAQTVNGSIKGWVRDSSSNKPVSFATVGLYRISNLDKPAKNLLTDNKGAYQFTQLDTGSYVVIVTHTGFREVRSAVVTITTETKQVQAQDILLATANGQLETFTVLARKPLIEQTDEKLIYNAEADPSSEGQTVLDIFRKTPFLSVDGEDNVQLNGQSNYRLLLNGRETAMFAKNAKDALRAFPANLVKRVEVITSPSSKYDAQGVGGIINIITKKKVAGYNGTLSVQGNTIGQKGINGSINYKLGSLGFNGYLNLLKFEQDVRNRNETESLHPVAFYKRSSWGAGHNTADNQYGNAELSYDFDSLTTISAYTDLYFGGSTNNNVRTFQVINAGKTDTTESIFRDDSRFNYPSLNWGVDFIRKFKDPDQELTVKSYFQNDKERSFVQGEQAAAAGTRYTENDNTSRNRQTTLQADYVQPVTKKVKMEAGVKGILRSSSSVYTSLYRYGAGEKFVLDENNSDRFSYKQNVYAAYLSGRFTIGKYSLRTGMRVEHTTIDGDFAASNTTIDQSYTSWVPNILLSRKFGKLHTLSLGYNKRISRPYIWDLNPFINNTDSLNLHSGNPTLQPVRYHAIEFGYSLLKGSTTINLRLTETLCNTQITNFSTFNELTGVTFTTRDNIGQYSSTSLNGNLGLPLHQKIRMNLNTGLRYEIIKNRLNPGQQNQRLGGNATLNFNYEAGKLNVFTNGNIHLPGVQIQGRLGMFYNYTIGANYKLLKNKLTFSVNLNSIFEKERRWHNRFEDVNFRTQSWRYAPARTIHMSLRWSFGKLTENVSRKRGVSNNDLKGRDN